jgi:hypothetical protein
MLWAGVETMNDRKRGVFLGSAVWLAFLVAALLGEQEILFDQAVFGDRVTRAPLFGLFILLSGVGLALHVTAIVVRLLTTDDSPAAG